MRKRRTRLWAVAAAAAVLAVAAVAAMYLRDIESLRARLADESSILLTRHGPTEFADGGAGSPVLIVHGAGGGYDQGRLLADAFLPDAYRWIAPSRFGYLRTPLPAEPSTAAQADAFADLLDALGIERVAVLAMSGGVPPALQCAQRHPDRVSALILLSLAPYSPLTAEEQDLPVPIWLYNALFRSDLPYWLLMRLVPRSLYPVYDARAVLRGSMTPQEQTFVARMVASFLPVTARIDGLQNEGAAIDPRARSPLRGLVAPTLIVHARDDGITPFATAEFTAAGIPHAEFLPLATGGHLLLGHHAEVAARIDAFLRRHAARG